MCRKLRKVDFCVFKPADSAPVKGPVTDRGRLLVLYEMLADLATFVSASHLIPLADRVKDAHDRADLEAAKAEFQEELDKHR